jgi:hypothetical protein
MTELDLRDHLGKSSFDYVANSDWLNELRKKDHHKIKPIHKHYIVFTYDGVFNVICKSFEMTLSESRLK